MNLNKHQKMKKASCVFIALACATIQGAGADTLSCASVAKNGLPCLEVPLCSKGTGKLTVSSQSSGNSSTVGTSAVDLCHDSTHLRIKNTAYGQRFFTEPSYSQCNDAIFNLDVSEAFIAPYIESDPGAYCYSEIDLNFNNVIFESGIYNPSLTRSAISNFDMDCDSSGIRHTTVVDKSTNSWSASVSVPWSVLNCPNGCPLSSYCKAQASRDQADAVYRINFYRVNELQALASGSVCNSNVCEYLAWSPNFKAPPSFHEPTYFGYIVLV